MHAHDGVIGQRLAKESGKVFDNLNECEVKWNRYHSH